QIVTEVDLDRARVMIDPPEGLFDGEWHAGGGRTGWSGAAGRTDASRRRDDLSGVSAAATDCVAGQGHRSWSVVAGGARSPRLDSRSAPFGGLGPVRRRAGHGHEAPGVGVGTG